MNVRSKTSKPYPEPPPSIAGLFVPSGLPMPNEIREPVWAALKMYFDSIRLWGRPYPGWASFERDLASQFVTLLLFLRALPGEDSRRQLIELFLAVLNLENKRGRRRKAKERLQSYIHGQRMNELWGKELQAAWNMKVSLEHGGKDPKQRLEKNFPEDVVRAVLSTKATCESSLAAVYAGRNHLSKGTTLNSLRAYKKVTRAKFCPTI